MTLNYFKTYCFISFFYRIIFVIFNKRAFVSICQMFINILRVSVILFFVYLIKVSGSLKSFVFLIIFPLLFLDTSSKFLFLGGFHNTNFYSSLSYYCLSVCLSVISFRSATHNLRLVILPSFVSFVIRSY